MNQFFSNYIFRNIYKFIYKTLTPKAYKHNRRFWPLYQVKRNANGDLQEVYFNKTLVSTNTTDILNTNKKCMLIATGPSIKTLDQEIFKKIDIDYIGVNGAISLNEIKFSRYIIIDHNFIESRFDLVQKVLDTNCIFFTTPRCLDAILRKVDFKNIACQIKTIETIKDNIVEVFLNKEMRIETNKEYFFFRNNLGFSENIFSGVFDYFTVAYVSLQIINNLGYKQVYIAGLDMNNFNNPRFYENIEDKQSTLLDIHTHDVLNAFNTAALFFKEKGVCVFNLSKHSAVDAFEKIDCNNI
ncbi:MAG: lipopolysaccharide biosynthesis protein [Acinetobacter sp.]|uniref:lipopolysaccharide biosynthesis protein n=1 Tax=Acinetobacter sp. TaxID=472 RepID=UPI00398286E6